MTLLCHCGPQIGAALLLHTASGLSHFIPTAGVVENILGRVLEAFQVRMGSLLGTALSKGFAENPALALQMAAEPAALLAGDPVAFFLGRATDTSEGFVKSVMQTGFGGGDESVDTSILTQLAQVCWCLKAQIVMSRTCHLRHSLCMCAATKAACRHATLQQYTGGIHAHFNVVDYTGQSDISTVTGMGSPSSHPQHNRSQVICKLTVPCHTS